MQSILLYQKFHLKFKLALTVWLTILHLMNGGIKRVLLPLSYSYLIYELGLSDTFTYPSWRPGRGYFTKARANLSAFRITVREILKLLGNYFWWCSKVYENWLKQEIHKTTTWANFRRPYILLSKYRKTLIKLATLNLFLRL